jgi:uncharacterized protein (DUF305 family)
MNKQILLSAVVALVLGLGVGYWWGNNSETGAVGMHQMPDGSLMSNDGMSMADMMSSMNDALAGRVGDEFDKAFLSEMIVHHEGAVGMAELALTNSNRQEIKNLARIIIDAQNQEISDMRSWMSAWYGTGN